LGQVKIDGVFVQELRQFVDERGKVMHMLRVDSPLFTRFGEVYFSVVNPGVVKAWKRHREMTQHLAVPMGKIRLVVFDDREGSPTRGNVEVLEIGEDNYRLVKIPPLLWYGFQGLSALPALIANCTDLPHSKEEVENREVTDRRIPFVWN
jgi:dTDP-4-dehydrorhamnose 3,5-epimerase